MGVEIVDICEDECEAGRLYVIVQLVNLSESPLEVDVDILLYGAMEDERLWLATVSPGFRLDSGWKSDSITITVSTDDFEDVMGILVVVDFKHPPRRVDRRCDEFEHFAPSAQLAGCEHRVARRHR